MTLEKPIVPLVLALQQDAMDRIEGKREIGGIQYKVVAYRVGDNVIRIDLKEEKQ